MYRSVDSTAERPRQADVDLTELPTEHLEAELCALASHLNAGLGRWIALVDEYDRREGRGKWSGVGSTAHWIAWQCGCSPRTAREHVRVARALRELPLTREAFSSGSLSYAKVRALTRVATPASEEFLLHQATYATAAQLERMLSAYEQSEAPDPEYGGEPKLSWHWNRDGSLSVDARLPADDGRALLDALEAARSPIGGKARASGVEGGSAEPPEGQHADRQRGSAEPLLGDLATNADALALIAESFLETGPHERPGPRRQQLLVHVDLEALAGAAGRSELENGPPIAAETARRLGCDSELRVLLKRGREALYLGRKTRTIPPALGLALRERDRGCRFPGCTNRRFTDAHHIVPRALGGRTDADNLISLCRRHHRAVHEGGLAISGDAKRGVVFRDPRGEILPNCPQPPPGSLPQLIERNRGAGLSLGPETLRKGDGERMDLVENVYEVARAVKG